MVRPGRWDDDRRKPRAISTARADLRAILSRMRQAFREFRSALPSVARYWIIIGVPGCLLIGLLGYRQTLQEAVAMTAVIVLGVGPPLLGLAWFQWWAERRGCAEFQFAVVWFVVLLLPAIVFGTLLYLGVQRVWRIG
jgi:hypothetical protein